MKAWTYLGVGAITLAAIGCRGDAQPGERGAPEGEPAYGDMAVVGINVDLDTMFPPMSNSIASGDVINQVFWYLMRSKADFINVEPGLADSFRFTSDSLSIDYFINPGARWHDGQPLTAADVVFAHQVCRAPEVNFPSVSWLDHIVDVRALDPHTVRFTFDEPYMYMIQDSNVCNPLPRHILGNVPMADIPTHPFTRAPVGSGPFRFVSWTPGQEVVIEAVPDFFRGRPYLNRVAYRIIPEPTTMATQVQNATIDVWPRFVATFYPQLEQDPDLVIHSYPGRSYTYVAYNTKDPLFEDKRVRQALTLAIDREQIVEALLHGQGAVGTQPLISTIWAHDETIRPYPYDVERARRLLEEAGWVDTDGDGIRERNGRRLSFDINTNNENTMRVDILTILQSQLRQVGAEARPAPIEFNTLIERLMGHNFQATVMGWSVGIKAELTPTFGADQPFNFPQVENARLDSLIRTAELERDRAKAKQIWSEAQRTIVDEAYYSFLFQLNDLHAIDDRFQNVEMTAYGWDHYMEKWYVPEGQQKFNVPIGGAPVAGAGADTTGGAPAR
jgi:peptide/nickel transport system substrate-binding protein